MSRHSGKTIWIIGASHGLGRALAKTLDAQGARLVISARSANRLNELALELNGATVIPMDVTDMMSVHRAMEVAGTVDHLVYNAGAYDPMHALEWNTDQALKMADVNFLGAMRMIGAVLPGFRAVGRGEITLIGSLAGYRGLPRAVGYGASKAALVSLAETLRSDLAGSGITVRIVNPGFIKTRLTDKNSFAMPQIMEPEAAAAKVARAMCRRRFRTDFPWPFSLVIRTLAILPDALVLRGK